MSAIDQSFTVKSGTLMIDNAQVSTRDLIMNWYGRPINTEIMGDNKGSDYLLTVSTAIDWQLEPLLENLPVTVGRDIFMAPSMAPVSCNYYWVTKLTSTGLHNTI